MEPDLTQAEEERLMRTICWGSAVCCVLTLLLIVAIGISGVVLAVKSRQSYPADDAGQVAAVRYFSTIATFHAGAGVGLLLLSFLLIVFSVLFVLHVVDFEPKHTTFRWAQVIKSVAVALLVIANTVIGKGYLAKMQSVYYWLVPPAGGFPEGTVVAKGQVVDLSTFTTFITFHAVFMTVVIVILVVLMWPPFYEFIKPRPAQGPQLKLFGPRNIE
jgi:hypothetical protein